jgi:hypothetical protein
LIKYRFEGARGIPESGGGRYAAHLYKQVVARGIQVVFETTGEGRIFLKMGQSVYNVGQSRAISGNL